MSFCENLKFVLFEKDIQLKELAGKIDIPYSTMLAYTRKSKNKIIPNLLTGYKIAKELNVTVEYLITGNPNDNYINTRKLLPVYKELCSLPVNQIKLISNLVHILYDINKRSTLNEV